MDKNKKIFHIISHFDVGGAERVAANIAKSATPGYEYHIVEVIRAHSEFTPVFIGELRAAGIRCHRAVLPEVHFHYIFERLAALTFPLWFLPLFIKHRPAVIHSHTEIPDMAVCCFFTLFPRLLRRCKVVRTIHNTRLWTGLKRTGRRVERLFRRLNANVSISQAVRDSYAAEYGQVTPIIYNGVAETPQRTYEGIVQGKKNILFAGRFEPQKGINTLIKVVRMMQNDERLHFHIVGDGSLRGDIERELGPLPCVTIRPPVHGLAAILASFDCLLMPSEFEGLGLLSVEATLAGLPVVANRCAGLEETLPRDWPLWVENNDADRFADILRHLADGLDTRQMMVSARAFAAEHFGVRRMQQRYEERYSS